MTNYTAQGVESFKVMIFFISVSFNAIYTFNIFDRHFMLSKLYKHAEKSKMMDYIYIYIYICMHMRLYKFNVNI
jgi:hypothetical protein